MQNFTLGKRGLPMLLFALILLIGSLPSYGQTCPTVSDNTQEFCDALATVADLQATDTGGGISWYDNQTSTNPIPENEILQNNKTYYAGADNGTTCPDARQTVIVTVSNTSPPALGQGEDEFFTPCERIADDPDANTIGDLRAGIDLVPRPGFTIEYFADQFDGDSPQLSDATLLVSGTNYFAGYVGANNSDTDQNNNTDCQSSRLPLRYEPIIVNAPEAAAEQTVCEGTTVGQLEAEGTNRWYRTETSEPPLNNTTVVENGVTYWATLIVPSDGPPCESSERTAVRVIVEPTALNESVQRLCESISREDVEFDVPRVLDLSPEGTTWFADATSTEALDPQTELEDGEDYFNRDNGSECSQDRVVVEFFPTPNAGSTTTVEVCSNDEPFDLVARINPSIIGAPDTNGIFIPALASGTTIFDPAVDAARQYTYRVEGNDDCETDESRITVVIEAAPNAGSDINETICSSEINNAIELAQEYVSYLENRDLTGTFDNNATPEVETFTLEQLAGAIAGQYQTSPFLPFSYTYTVGEESGCQDSAQINLTIFESPYAGEDAIVNLSEEGTDQINLFDRLGGTPDENGTWSNGDGMFDPETDAPGVFTYTITSTNGCIDSATVTVQGDCPVTITETQRFCESIGEGNDFDRPRVRNLESTLDNPTWFADEALTQELTPETLLVDGEEYFSADSSECIIEKVTVELFDTPNAGSTTTVTVCSNDAPFDLVDFINDSQLGAPDRNGTFTPTFASGTTIFDPSVDAARQYIYTIEGNEDCPTDDSRITVVINVAPNAGEDGSIELSRQGNPVNLFTYLNGNPDAGGIWTPGNMNGDFDPSTDEAGVYTYTLSSGNCESFATVTVTLTDDEIICPIVTDSEQAFCQSIGEGNNFRRPIVSDLLPSNAIWYATADSDEPLTSTTILIDGEDYFAGNEDGTCTTRGRVVVILDDSPNAGATTNITVCGTDEPFDLLSRMNPSILGAPDTGGTFSPALASGTTIFDPSVDAAGQYTYTVQSTNDACPDDDARITVNITEPTNANAGEDVEVTFCSNDGIIDLYTLIPEGANTDGIFEGYENGQFDTSANIGENEITYTVDDEEGCVIAGSATYSITVFEAPNAGPGADLNFCITDIQEMSTEEAIAIFENLIPDEVTDGG